MKGIYNLSCLIQLLKEEERRREESRSKTQFNSPKIHMDLEVR